MHQHATDVHTTIEGANAPATNNIMSQQSQKCHEKRSPSPCALGRSSFSSIRERDPDLTQTFTSSKISSYSSRNLPHLVDEAVIADEFSLPTSPQAGPAACVVDLPTDDTMLLFPKLLNVGDTDSASGGEQNDAVQSVARSLSWLRSSALSTSQSAQPLHGDRTFLDGSSSPVDNADAAMEDVEDVVPARTPKSLELLPVEVYRLVIDHLILDTIPNGVDRRNVDLMSLLLTSKRCYAKTEEVLYRRVVVPHSRTFRKFLAQLEADKRRGAWVRRLDFSHLSPVSLFSTAGARAAAKNLTAESLLRCLELTPNLREFLCQDYLDTDLDERVVRKLFTGLPMLRAIDLCGCSSVQARNAFAALAVALESGSSDSFSDMSRGNGYLGIERLSLHKCSTIPSSAFEVLLPRLDRITHLELAGTHVTDTALWSIPRTARITHLNLAKCSKLTPRGVTDFLTHHPAVNQGSLVFLSLASSDASSFRLLDSDDVSRLLPVLPKTLVSLSLKGSSMNETHVPWLREHATHLEELALGRGLGVGAVNAIVAPPKTRQNNRPGTINEDAPHTLRYLDISDMDEESLNLSALFVDGLLVDNNTKPLEVIEVSDTVYKRISKARKALDHADWRQSELGNRTWLVRGRLPGASAASTQGRYTTENGQRPWKMGAQAWGMRKIPVAEAKVGGMYGSYMFGRKL